MKVKALILAVLLLLMGAFSTFGYFTMLNSAKEQNVFAYADESHTASIQMKLLSRGDDLDRKERETKLKLMTFNMHRGIDKNGRLDLGAIAEVITASDANIIALQEVERYSIRTGFQDQIKKLSEKTEMNYAYSKSTNILNGEYGNGLLSKYPIEEYKAIDLPSYGEQRTVLRAIINVNGLRLVVYNTHLGLKAIEREEQLEFIMQMISEETLEYILMGDLNTKINKLKMVTDTMKDSAQNSEKLQQSTFEEEGIQERIDYIFVSSNIKVVNYDVILSEASDHYPVISEIVMGE